MEQNVAKIVKNFINSERDNGVAWPQIVGSLEAYLTYALKSMPEDSSIGGIILDLLRGIEE